jgi:hypothetical protein
MRCHFPQNETGRTKLFAFSWLEGGYNQVYARDKADAIAVANEAFGMTPQKLRVLEATVREVDPTTYWKTLPIWD